MGVRAPMRMTYRRDAARGGRLQGAGRTVVAATLDRPPGGGRSAMNRPAGGGDGPVLRGVHRRHDLVNGVGGGGGTLARGVRRGRDSRPEAIASRTVHGV